MSQARIDFLARLVVLERTLSEQFVQDGALHEVEKNQVARLVRNGLAVVAFSQLEDFIRIRTAEVLTSISSSGLTFTQLPERVQKASTLGLLNRLLKYW